MKKFILIFMFITLTQVAPIHAMNLEEAIGVAEEFLHKAIKTAPQLGKGHGPVNHLHTIRGY